jgi:hypothetical protein
VRARDPGCGRARDPGYARARDPGCARRNPVCAGLSGKRVISKRKIMRSQ